MQMLRMDKTSMIHILRTLWLLLEKKKRKVTIRLNLEMSKSSLTIHKKALINMEHMISMPC